MQYSLVLSDDLQQQYSLFKEGGTYERDMVEQLLHYYKGSILTNTAQLKRIVIKLS